MEVTPQQEHRPSFDSDAMGRPQTWVVHDRGLEYIGEAIVAEAVDPSWGLPLEGELSFRVVFLTEPRRIPPSRLLDPRIAMAVPRRPLSQAGQTVGRELRSVHEAGERYVTARDPDANALRRSIEEREMSLRGELARRYSAAYSSGRIYTHLAIKDRPADVFEEPRPEAWTDRLASAVLLAAYPSLPIDSSEFPATLTPDRTEALYRGLFQGEQDAARVAREFGPGLGLTRPESPALFDAGDCRALSLIRQELEEHDGEIQAQEIIRALTHEHGLTTPLAVLFLIAFIRQDRAELALQQGHQIESLRGGRFLGDRITWDLVAEVTMSQLQAQHLGMLRLSPSPTWNTTVPYATLLDAALGPTDDETDIAVQERRLLEVLGGMDRMLGDVQETLTGLAERLGSGRPGALGATGPTPAFVRHLRLPGVLHGGVRELAGARWAPRRDRPVPSGGATDRPRSGNRTCKGVFGRHEARAGQ